jgi:hypothetical protein
MLLIGACLTAVAIAGCGGGGGGGGGSSPSVLSQELSAMIHNFGAGAKVVRIGLANNGADFEVMTSDGSLHRRLYACNTKSCSTTGTDEPVLKPTKAELRVASLQLSQLSASVPPELVSKVGLPDAELVLEGHTWTITSVGGASAVWKARYDGTGLKQIAAAPASSGTTPSPSTPSTTGIPSSAASTLAKSEKLLTCIQAAQQNVTKILACQRRFQP